MEFIEIMQSYEIIWNQSLQQPLPGFWQENGPHLLELFARLLPAVVFAMGACPPSQPSHPPQPKARSLSTSDVSDAQPSIPNSGPFGVVVCLPNPETRYVVNLSTSRHRCLNHLMYSWNSKPAIHSNLAIEISQLQLLWIPDFFHVSGRWATRAF